MGELLSLERRNGVVRLVMGNPGGQNVIDFDWCAEALSALRTVGAPDGCLVLASSLRNFSVGGDIRAFAGPTPDRYLFQLTNKFHELARTIRNMDVPVVSAVRGWAAGGGFSFACMADTVIASETARFKVAYDGIGLVSDGGLLWELAHCLPPPIANDLALTGRTMYAQEALDRGLVSRLVPDDALEAATMEVAETLAAKSRFAIATSKRLLRDARSASYASHLDRESVATSLASETQDGHEGVTAFLERREPAFGRVEQKYDNQDGEGQQ